MKQKGRRHDVEVLQRERTISDGLYQLVSSMQMLLHIVLGSFHYQDDLALIIVVVLFRHVPGTPRISTQTPIFIVVVLPIHEKIRAFSDFDGFLDSIFLVLVTRAFW